MKYALVAFVVSENMGWPQSVPENAAVSLQGLVFDTEEQAQSYIANVYAESTPGNWYGYIPVTFIPGPYPYPTDPA